MKKESQTIKCNVISCDYQNKNYCTLDAIEVGCISNNNKASKNQETLCESFRNSNEEGKNLN